MKHALVLLVTLTVGAGSVLADEAIEYFRSGFQALNQGRYDLAEKYLETGLGLEENLQATYYLAIAKLKIERDINEVRSLLEEASRGAEGDEPHLAQQAIVEIDATILPKVRVVLIKKLREKYGYKLEGDYDFGGVTKRYRKCRKFDLSSLIIDKSGNLGGTLYVEAATWYKEAGAKWYGGVNGRYPLDVKWNHGHLETFEHSPRGISMRGVNFKLANGDVTTEYPGITGSWDADYSMLTNSGRSECP